MRYSRLPNIVADYNVVQGTSHPSDLSVHIIRDYNVRYVTIENSSRNNAIGVWISTDCCIDDNVPAVDTLNGVSDNRLMGLSRVNFYLQPGAQRHIAINTIGSRMQFIHLLDPQTGGHVGVPSPFNTNANQFVLRDDVKEWFVQNYYRATYAAAH